VSDPEREQLEAEIARLRAIVEAQAALIAELRSRVEELESRLGKDSSNSSLPPSRDRTDRRARRAAEAKQRRAANKALGKAARKPGKQNGAPGATLARRTPDDTVVHAPEICSGCGASLADAPVVGQATRQVLEVPEPALEAIDHVVVRKRCSCGAETRGEFPPEATGPVCWGPRVKATGAYLLARQHLPLERASEAMADLFAAPMGEGTLAGLLPEAAAGLGEFMSRLVEALHCCPVVHADETSVRIGVGLGWVHTVSSRSSTHLAVHERRGIDGIVAIGVLTGYTGTIVHDGLASYDCEELAAATHAQCNQHLQRSLGDLATHASQTPWACAMKALLTTAKTASVEAAAAGLASVPDAIAGPIRHRYDEILTQALAWLPGDAPPPRKHTGGWTNAEREAWNLATRMRRHKDQVLRLLEDTRVPADNNEAERSFRMCKIHDKVSGHFRSWAHARAFCTVRSYLQTGAKHGRDAMELLIRLWTPTGAWLPSVTGPDTG
jgi:transposase